MTPLERLPIFEESGLEEMTDNHASPVMSVEVEFENLYQTCHIVLEALYLRHSELVETAELLDQRDIGSDGYWDHLIPNWRDFAGLEGRAICHTLLAVLVERSLLVCMVHHMERPPKKKRNVAYVDTCLAALITAGVSAPSVLPESLVHSRRVRNAFAHGDFEELAPMLSQHRLTEAFDDFYDFFTSVHAALLVAK